MKGERQTQRREANALTSRRAAQNARTSHGRATSTSHARAGAATGASCARAAYDAPAPLGPPRPSPRPQHPNETPRNGKIRASCMIRGVCAAKKAPSWQDIHLMHPPTAICRAFRIHGARILPKSAHFGCMAAICCQEGALFPSEAPFGIHEAQNLPRIAARERTRAKYCHCKALGNASEHNLAIARHPGTHQDEILPSPGTRERTVASRSRETPREQNIGQFNTTR